MAKWYEEYNLVETTEQIGKRYNKTWFKNDDVRLTPEYQKHLKEIESERWVRLSWLEEQPSERTVCVLLDMLGIQRRGK